MSQPSACILQAAVGPNKLKAFTTQNQYCNFSAATRRSQLPAAFIEFQLSTTASLRECFRVTTEIRYSLITQGPLLRHARFSGVPQWQGEGAARPRLWRSPRGRKTHEIRFPAFLGPVYAVLLVLECDCDYRCYTGLHKKRGWGGGREDVTAASLRTQLTVAETHASHENVLLNI